MTRYKVARPAPTSPFITTTMGIGHELQTGDNTLEIYLYNYSTAVYQQIQEMILHLYVLQDVFFYISVYLYTYLSTYIYLLVFKTRLYITRIIKWLLCEYCSHFQSKQMNRDRQIDIQISKQIDRQIGWQVKEVPILAIFTLLSSIRLKVYVRLYYSFYLSIHLYIHLSIDAFIYLSIYLYIYIFVTDVCIMSLQTLGL